MAKKVSVTKKERELIEKELRRGTSKSRISALLDVDYEAGQEMIQLVQDSIRPEIGDQIKFKFRASDISGIITKLLENSAVVEIYWDYSDRSMEDILENRTIVNFKDIVEFTKFAQQPEDEGLELNPEPLVTHVDFSQETEAGTDE